MPFIGKQSTSNSQITNYTTTVGSGGQTNFTVVIEGGDETHVYLNGVLLKETTDYTVSSTQVSLVSPAVENDIVEIKVFRSFALVDAVRASDGGTFSGDVTVPNLTLSSNVIKASDGGSTITLDDSDNVTLAGNLVLPDGGNIGSASDTDAISIASNGKPTFSAGIANTGTIDAGTFNGTVGSSATGIPTQSWAYASGINAYNTSANTVVEWNGTRDKSGFTFGPSDNNAAYQIKPATTGYYFINYTINFWNEPPNSGTEDDSGSMRLYFNTTNIQTVNTHFHVETNPTSSHEGDSYTMSRIYQVTSTGTDDWFSVRAVGFNNITGTGGSNYNETHDISIVKIA